MPLDFNTAITIILAVLGVILTALAIMIALLAWWGYSGIKEEAKKTAERAISEYLEKQFVKDKLRTEVLPIQIANLDQSVTAIPYTGEEEKSHADSDDKTK